ncbi:short-chain dehydrogenase/reductase SDR [alpha proteobacterium BAL199]|jgi:2-dehydro-3-deoxy-L-rhamnonate dehydrogenase (NAD+)|nr:short-chain dehydrogenase/reductase SDR [alpha proteobacterium BAL199]
MNTLDLDGRVAVITGGARGIGLAVAERLLESGARVALWDADRAALDAARDRLDVGDRLISATVDITAAAAVGAARDAVMQTFGRLDILVNSAGIAGPTVPTLDYGLDDWRRVIDVNLTGTFLVCKTLAPLMVERGWGRIVNIASLAGKEGTPNAPAYSASKAAVIAFTKSFGKELAATGVLANSVAPAALDTDMVRHIDPKHVQIMVSKSPLGRLGTAEECAALVAWLCSPDCSFSTGATFDLSGGRAVY